MPEPSIAYLSQRKLHVRQNGATKTIESDYARQVRERAASIDRRHAWKSQGRGAMFMGAAAQAVQPDAPIVLTGLAPAPAGALLYSMETDAVSGIFLLDSAGLETRLFHTADFRIRHLALNPAGEKLAVAIFHKDNSRSSIAVLPLRGTDFTEITEGDSFDQAPRWTPGGQSIVFQSAGIGRNQAGHFAGLAPCAIQEYDAATGGLAEAAADPARDLLRPARDAEGALYYIRKPYESGAPDASFLSSLKDAALFPFRLGRAIFQYFNVFSMMYTGKPLVSAKGAAQRRMDPRQMFINGNLAAAAMSQADSGDGPGAAPASWELIRHPAGGRPEVLAKRVLAYDLMPGGAVLYSDGATITQLDASGRAECVVRAESIEQVLAL